MCLASVLRKLPKIHEKESDAALNLYSYHLPLRHHPRLWESYYEHYEVSIGSIQYLLAKISNILASLSYILQSLSSILASLSPCNALTSWNVLGYEEEEDYTNCCQYKSVGQHRWCRSWSWLMTINTASDKLSEHKLLKTKKIIACAVTYWFPTTGGSRWNQSLD